MQCSKEGEGLIDANRIQREGENKQRRKTKKKPMTSFPFKIIFQKKKTSANFFFFFLSPIMSL